MIVTKGKICPVDKRKGIKQKKFFSGRHEAKIKGFVFNGFYSCIMVSRAETFKKHTS
jgi:hypothetical protein